MMDSVNPGTSGHYSQEELSSQRRNNKRLSPAYCDPAYCNKSSSPNKHSKQPLSETDLTSCSRVSATSPVISRDEPEYQAYFVENKKEYDYLCARILNQSREDDSPCHIIHTPEDFQNDGLMRKFLITNHQCQSKAGELFSGKPVTLIIDCRHLQKARRLPELNELFEQPARLGGRDLSPQVRIISLLSRGIFPVVEGDTDKVGPDFCWRINGSSPPVSVSELLDLKSDKEPPEKYLARTIPMVNAQGSGEEQLMDTDALEYIVTIDFTGRDWRAVLSGTPTLDGNGQLIYQPGDLQQKLDQKTLILKNAPWDNQAFLFSLATLLQKREMTCNGQTLTIPADLTLYRQALSDADLEQFRNRLVWGKQWPESLSDMAVLNQDNFELCTQDLVIDEQGHIRPQKSLKAWLNECRNLRITSPLNQHQWIRLIKQIQEQGLEPITVYCDEPDRQPGFIMAPDIAGSPPDTANHLLVASETSFGTMDASTLASTAGREFIVTPEDSLLKITQRNYINSLEQLHFTTSPTHFLQALRNGDPVCIRGLEYNPVLMNQLESLLSSPPHLMLYGKREVFPSLKLTIVWPAEQKADSPLWQQHLNEQLKTMPEARDVGPGQGNNVTGLYSKEFNKFIKQLLALKPAMYCPASPPENIQAVYNKILIQADIERALDGAHEVSKVYIGKAVNSILLKEYRGNPETYYFLKTLSTQVFGSLTDCLPDFLEKEQECSKPFIDLGKLEEWVRQQPYISENVISEHFWRLNRHIFPCPFPLVQPPGKEVIKKLAALVAVIADKSEIRAEFHFKPSRKELAWGQQLLDTCTPWNRTLAKAVSDLLLSLSAEERQSGLISEQAGRIMVAMTTGDSLELQEALQSVLTRTFSQKHGNEVAEFLRRQPFIPDWRIWEQRRLKRVVSKVQRHPVVFIKGETGAGKSHIAAIVARELNPDPDNHFVLNVGPETDIAELFGQNCLRKNDQSGDSYTELEPGPLLQWARQVSNKIITLVIDEANLAVPELWNCLAGLYESPPFIHYQGQRLEVTQHHRIIMTGNPEHFSGRRINGMLRARAPQLYYRPLDQDFLTDKILRPHLTAMISANCRQTFAEESASGESVESLTLHALEAIKALYKNYQKLMPERLFTPRDLTDSLSRMEEYLRMKPSGAVNAAVDKPALNCLIWQSLSDTLGGEFMPERKGHKKALNQWFKSRYTTHDETRDEARDDRSRGMLRGAEEQFERFYLQWKMERTGHPFQELELNNASVHQLMGQLWRDITRCQQEKRTGRIHGGRHATVIEGPAGRGKSLLMDQLLTRMQQQINEPLPQQINAGHRSWHDLKSAISRAKEQGHILIVSEINLLKSQQIEGLLNDAMTGRAAPGFHLFTTVNPVSYQGRNDFSAALKSRFTRLIIDEYSADDLAKITSSFFPDTEHAERVLSWHLGLLQVMKEKRCPIMPAAADLKRLAREVRRREADSVPLTVKKLSDAFRMQYQLYLTMIYLPSGERLPEYTPEPSASHTLLNKLERQTDYLLEQLSTREPCPVSVSPEARRTYYDKMNQSMVFGAHLDNEQALVESLRVLATENWTQYGAPDVCPDRRDTLFKALYHLWQQRVFRQDFPQYADKGDAVYPLDEKESELIKATLALAVNGPIVEKAQLYLDRQPTTETVKQLWSTLLEPLPKNTAGEGAPAGDKGTDSTLNPAPTPSEWLCPPQKSSSCDGRTGKYQNVKHWDVDTVFQNSKSDLIRFHKVRYRTYDLEVLSDGDVNRIEQELGQCGYDVLLPEALSAPVALEENEYYGVISLPLDSGLQVLPGLGPHDTITGLLTEPAIPLHQLHIVRDRYAGSFLVGLKSGCALPEGIEKCTIHYRLVFGHGNYPTTGLGIDLKLKPCDKLTQIIEEMFDRYPEMKALLPGNSNTASRNNKELAEQLYSYCRKFKNEPLERSSEQEVEQSEVDLLCQIIRQRRGVCRHRSWAYYALARYYQLPVRIVGSRVHDWVELSVDGINWESCELGGGGIHTVSIREADAIPAVNSLRMSPDLRLLLLKEAKDNPEKFSQKYKMSLEDVLSWVKSDGEAPLPTESLSHFNAALTDKPESFFELCSMLNGQEDIGKLTSLLYDSLTLMTHYPDFTDQLQGAISRIASFLNPTERQNKFERLVYSALVSIGEPRFSFSRKEPSLSRPAAIDFFQYCLKHHLKGDELSPGFIHNALFELDEAGLDKVTFFRPYIDSSLAKQHQRLDVALPRLSPLELCPSENIIGRGDRGGNAIEIKGCSRKLERQLLYTQLGEHFSWQAEGTIDVGHLIQRKPPFRNQTATQALRLVRIIKNTETVLCFDKELIEQIQVRLSERLKPPLDLWDFCERRNHLNKLFRSVPYRERGIDCGLYARSVFDHSYNEKAMDRMLLLLEKHGVGIPDYLQEIIEQRKNIINPIVDWLKEALPDAFLDYFAKTVGIHSGNVRVYQQGVSDNDAGYWTVQTRGELKAALAMPNQKFCHEKSSFARYCHDKDSLFFLSEDMNEYFREFRVCCLDDLIDKKFKELSC